jgi:sterol carrier protein 2
MTKFVKPKSSDAYPELGFEASIKAILDAYINHNNVDEGIASFVYRQSCSGQRLFYQFGMTQIPIYNISNNCVSGSIVIELVRSKIYGSPADCILAVGFEKINPGSIKLAAGIQSPFTISMRTIEETRGYKDTSFACQIFSNAGIEYAERSVTSLQY